MPLGKGLGLFCRQKVIAEEHESVVVDGVRELVRALSCLRIDVATHCNEPLITHLRANGHAGMSEVLNELPLLLFLLLKPPRDLGKYRRRHDIAAAAVHELLPASARTAAFLRRAL